MIQPDDATSTVSSVFPLWIELGTLIMRRAMSVKYQNRKRQALFDHLVRAGKKVRRDFDAERFRRLQINDKQVFGGLLDRKLGRFGAFQNSIDIVSPKSGQGGKVRARKKSIHPLAQSFSPGRSTASLPVPRDRAPGSADHNCPVRVQTRPFSSPTADNCRSHWRGQFRAETGNQPLIRLHGCVSVLNNKALCPKGLNSFCLGFGVFC